MFYAEVGDTLLPEQHARVANSGLLIIILRHI